MKKQRLISELNYSEVLYYLKYNVDYTIYMPHYYGDRVEIVNRKTGKIYKTLTKI